MRASRVLPEHDAYGQEIWNCYQSLSTYEIVERDDGLIDVGTAQPYFYSASRWSAAERQAIERAHGTVLDIGCGAGRVALYLQQKGNRVLAIDNSPLAVKVAKLRGVKSARILAIRDIARLPGPFDTIVLYGNNFGLFGGMAEARRLLGIMHRITAPDATIIASTTDPYQTTDPIHLAYHRRNKKRRRMGGQLRLRIRYRQFQGNWFDYLLVSTAELRGILANTGWNINSIVQSEGPGYVAILEKG